MRSKQSTIIYDREGKELFRFYDDKDREFVSVDEVSDEVKWSVLAAEDISFYRHEGLRPLRIIKCAVLTPINIVSKGKFGMVCGASTLSQQMVRNVILPDFIGDKAYERSLWRKYLEIVTTLMVETK
jgi:penicillin-binding protein